VFVVELLLFCWAAFPLPFAGWVTDVVFVVLEVDQGCQKNSTARIAATTIATMTTDAIGPLELCLTIMSGSRLIKQDTSTGVLPARSGF
jgi:hypothetical protein